MFTVILPQRFLSITTAKVPQSVQMISAHVDEVMSGMIRCDNPKLGLLACPSWHKGQTLDAVLVLRYASSAAQDARSSSTHQHNADTKTQQKTCQTQLSTSLTKSSQKCHASM